MTTNEKYPEKQWKTISTIAQLTGLLMSTAIYSGEEGTKDELKASARSITEGKIKFPDNQLIESLIPSGNNQEETLQNTSNQQKEIISRYRITNREDLKNFQKSVYAAYEEVVYNISQIETAVTVKEFKQWLLYIAEEVAVAAIEGSVFGKNADPFSEEERVVFNKIENTLKKF